jgi:hypothetical protein
MAALNGCVAPTKARPLRCAPCLGARVGRPPGVITRGMAWVPRTPISCSPDAPRHRHCGPAAVARAAAGSGPGGRRSQVPPRANPASSRSRGSPPAPAGPPGPPVSPRGQGERQGPGNRRNLRNLASHRTPRGPGEPGGLGAPGEPQEPGDAEEAGDADDAKDVGDPGHAGDAEGEPESGEVEEAFESPGLGEQGKPAGAGELGEAGGSRSGSPAGSAFGSGWRPMRLPPFPFDVFASIEVDTRILLRFTADWCRWRLTKPIDLCIPHVRKSGNAGQRAGLAVPPEEGRAGRRGARRIARIARIKAGPPRRALENRDNSKKRVTLVVGAGQKHLVVR